MAVALEEVYDAFGFGEVSPEAIHDFLSFAYHHWTAPSPRYVLLLGEATSDPKEFIAGRPRKDLLPTALARTSYLWTASDPALASVNGEDLLPDLAIGRLTANSLDEAQAAVQKILDFENAGLTLDGKAVLVADKPDPDAGDFEANVNDIASLLSERPTQKLFRTQLVADPKAAVLDAFNTAPALVSYVGHGDQGNWSSILSFNDVPRLSPQAQLPLVLTMTCSNGNFLHPASNSLAEVLTLTPEQGRHRRLLPLRPLPRHRRSPLPPRPRHQLETGTHHRLGDLVLAAQAEYTQTGAFPELLAIYHLFGDPALKIR